MTCSTIERNLHRTPTVTDNGHIYSKFIIICNGYNFDASFAFFWYFENFNETFSINVYFVTKKGNSEIFAQYYSHILSVQIPTRIFSLISSKTNFFCPPIVLAGDKSKSARTPQLATVRTMEFHTDYRLSAIFTSLGTTKLNRAISEIRKFHL